MWRTPSRQDFQTLKSIEPPDTSKSHLKRIEEIRRPITATLSLATRVLQCGYRRLWANGWFPEKQGDLEECRAKTPENYFKASE